MIHNILSRIEKSFAMSTSDMHKMMRGFRSEMERGLRGEKSSLKMIPTYVDAPTGREKGEFVALDLGGTNFRIIEIALKGGGRTGRPRAMKFVMDKRHRSGPGTELFDFIAACMEKFLKKYKAAGGVYLDLGFTFSFPVRQTAVASGTLISWTKDFTATGVIGEDVVRLLNEALERRLIYNVRVSALLNDTVGTLVAKAYEDRFCDVGVILGTGTNACYSEEIKNIKKGGGLSSGTRRMIINTEWGDFNKFKLNSYDRALDKFTKNRNRQILEKAVSGMYLGELVRLVSKGLIKEKTLFSGRCPAIFERPEEFRTEYVSMILADNSGSLPAVKRFLEKTGVKGSSLKDRMILKKICRIVATRAGRISAAALGAVVMKMDPRLSRRHTVAIDGSVYEKLPGFAATMCGALMELFGRKAGRIKIALSKDGSGTGAAIVAAVAKPTYAVG